MFTLTKKGDFLKRTSEQISKPLSYDFIVFILQTNVEW